MAEPHVISALRDKRSELAGLVMQLERQLQQYRGDLTHLDATMLLFDPDIRPETIRAKLRRPRSSWFGQGECLRLIYDELRDAPQPVTTRALSERIMRVKAMTTADERQRELVHKVVLGSLGRARQTIERIETAGSVSWRLRQAA
jgi:hypothetical protein